MSNLFEVEGLQFHSLPPKLIILELGESVIRHLVFIIGFSCGAVFGTPWLWIAVGLGVVSLVTRLIIIPMQVRAFQFALGPTDLFIRKGVFYRSLSTVPYGRIQTVSISQGPVMRHLGFTVVSVKTAEGHNAIHAVPFEHTHSLREYLSARCDANMIGL